MSEQIYKKRVYNEKLFLEDLIFLSSNLPALLDAYRRWQSDWSFAEKIMLAVTSVNRCRYCQWLHTDLATASGAESDQLMQILSHETGSVSDYEKPAICYAYHYAETERNPKPEMVEEIKEFYGEQKAADIDLFIRFIFFGNLSGNTFDALISRTKGYSVPHSNPVFEVFFAAFSAMPLLAIAFFTRGGINPLSGLEHAVA